ncbi:MAG: twitching motility protein PilT [Acidimicrobiales bacterium]
MSVVYDAAVLVAADRDDRNAWADHRIRLELGVVPRTTAPVVAQVSRSDRQAQLQRFLRGCETVAFLPEQAHEVGALLGRARTHDVVDAHLVLVAAETASAVLTSDVGDLRSLSNQLPVPVSLLRA